MASFTGTFLPTRGPELFLGCGGVLILLAVIAAVRRVVYSLFFHPLRNFPGPWYTACSSLPLGIAGLSRSEPEWLCGLVEKYGGT